MTTRRSFLTGLGTLPISAWGLSSRAIAGPRAAGSVGDTSTRCTSPSGTDAMDEALEMLAPYGPSFRGGLSNHGPMTAEALVSMERADAVVAWVARYRNRLEKRSATTQAIDAKAWREALGKQARNRDWEDWFENELAEAPWQKVLEVWVPRLAPGVAAAALHGVIRVGHAVCSLRVQENAARLDELARSLAYWASEFLLLPGEYAKAGQLAPSLALREIEVLPSDRRRGDGLISSELQQLAGFQPFVGVIDLVDPAAGTPNFMADLLATFAGLYVNTKSSTFQFLHAVTGAAAIVELLPYVKNEQRAAVQAYAWQATGAIFARYGKPQLRAEVAAKDSLPDAALLVKRAVASGDEHTIKLVAACTRESRRNPDPRVLAAAARRAR
tara:strand:+ start:4441 stop:5598 length:1158 start_codon:yes stop_codon:yes gene_type:complete